MDDFRIHPLLFGLIMVALLFFAIEDLDGVTDQYRKMAEQAIAECEATLPRNQTCEVVITAEVKE